MVFEYKKEKRRRKMAFPPLDKLPPKILDGTLTALALIARIYEHSGSDLYRSKQLNALLHQFHIMSDRIVFVAIATTFAEHLDDIHSILNAIEAEDPNADTSHEELTLWSKTFSEADLLVRVAAAEQRTLCDDYVAELYDRFKQTFEKLGGDFFRALDESALDRGHNPEIWRTS